MKNIILLNVALVCCFISFVGGKYSSDLQTESKLEKVVNWNTKQIHSLGIVAATDSYNAEVMIQILNLIEGREIKPPVRETISEMITSDESIEDDDVPHTFEQVAKDQREVDQSIRAFGSANLFQAETLENILNKLQGGNYLQ